MRVRISCKGWRKKIVFILVLVLCGIVAIGIRWLNVTEFLETADQELIGMAGFSPAAMKLLTERKTTSSSLPKQSWDRMLTGGDPEDVYMQRGQQSQAVCGQHVGEKGNVSMWTTYRDTAYCILPKVGCTFWKSVFRFLHGDTGGSYSSPFHIPRTYVHTGHMRSMKIYRKGERTYLKSNFRFLFVRDPYSRLFSAYVDKFLLPDFWGRTSLRITELWPNNSNARCGSEISFKEFLEFVVTERRAAFDNHWRPAHLLCSPCLFQPHVIGKMETFGQDVQYILKHLNSSWMMSSYTSRQHALQEIDVITRYNFDIFRSRIHVHSCIDRLQLARRLWRAFQINGYIPSGRSFPDDLTDEVNAEQFVRLVQGVYVQAAQNERWQARQQKRRMMVEAYRDVSSETLDKLKAIYKNDFLMFQYDPQPADIFRRKKEA